MLLLLCNKKRWRREEEIEDYGVWWIISLHSKLSERIFVVCRRLCRICLLIFLCFVYVQLFQFCLVNLFGWGKKEKNYLKKLKTKTFLPTESQIGVDFVVIILVLVQPHTNFQTKRKKSQLFGSVLCTLRLLKFYLNHIQNKSRVKEKCWQVDMLLCIKNDYWHRDEGRREKKNINSTLERAQRSRKRNEQEDIRRWWNGKKWNVDMTSVAQMRLI